MRKLPKPTEQEVNEGPQSVSFQIANGNARGNWPIIEKMARNALAAGTFEGGQIKLVMM
jgi:hypothetical protein